MKNHFRQGFLFPFPVRFLGYVLIVLFLFTIVHSLFYGLLLFCIGVLLGFPTYGAEIDERNKRIREYVKYFIPKYGKWFDYSTFDYLSIREKKLNARIYFSSNQSFTTKDEKFEVFLTDSLLRKKIVITENKSFKDAQVSIEDLIKKTNIPFKNYFEIVTERKKYLTRNRT